MLAGRQRWYDWAWITMDPGCPGCCRLLIRRTRQTRELAFTAVTHPVTWRLDVLVRVAGIRWSRRRTFAVGMGLAGLDEHQVRRWASWSRWVALAPEPERGH